MCSGGLQAAGFRRAKARRYTICLLRVEFDDELFLNRQTDVFPLRKIVHRSSEFSRIEFEPWRNATATGRFHRLADLIVLAAFFANLNDISLSHLRGRNVDFLSVDLDVSVTHELTGLRTRRCES